MSLKPSYDQSHALIIGIDAFKNAPPLATARPGAEAVAEVLADRYRFDNVVTLYDADATKVNVEDAYAGLRGQMQPDDRFVVYVAGHGVGLEGQVRSEGFVVAHDSDPGAGFRLIKMRDLVDPNFTRAKHAFVILDTCHSGFAVTYEAPRAVIKPPPDPRLAMKQFLTRKAYQVLASANPLETATDAPLLEGHTPFTGYLLRALRGEDDAARSPVTNLLTASSVAEYVRSGIAAFSGNWQGPQTGILPGDGGGVLVWELPDALDVLPERLRRALLSDSADARYYALADAERLLGKPQYASALEEVLREIALNDPDAEVKSRAMDVLLEARRIPEPAVEIVEPAPEAAAQVEIQGPEPEPEAERLEFEPETILIPAGPFLMGSPTSDKLRFDQEPEQFELNLDHDYAIGKYPVTVGQYRAFIEAGGYYEPRYWTEAGRQTREKGTWTEPRYWGESPWTDSDNLPVVGVSWYEVYAYTRWLAEVTGRGYRLPTEAEWEKAARGGLMIPDGKGGMKKNPNPARLWPWGDEQPDEGRLNFNRNVGHTTPVGQYPEGVSPYGAFDMAGNVWEWCLSKWADPFTHPEDNSPGGDSTRVLRGGSFFDLRQHGRASCRSGSGPNYWDGRYGFRVVVVPL